MIFNWFKKKPNTDPFIWKLELKDGNTVYTVYDDLNHFYRIVGEPTIYKTEEEMREALPSPIRSQWYTEEITVKNSFED